MNSEVTAGPGLLTDRHTVQALLDFFNDEEKPNDLGPFDLLIMVYLISRKGEDHAITDSLQTISRRLNCSVKTIERAVENLVSKNYLTRTRRRGRSSELSLNFAAIPCEAPLRLKISEDAGRLAVWYKLELSKRRLRTKFGKRYISQQEPSAQRILDKCDGDMALAKKKIDHALGHALHRNKAKKGLYELFGRWPKIAKTFLESQPITPPSPIEPSALEHDASRLARSVVNTLGLQGATDFSDWEGAATKLLDRGNSFEQILAVLGHVRKTLGDEEMRSFKPAVFEQNFEAIGTAMKGAAK
jgi:hypothetical protein